ncbi:hypothetical protein LGM54_22530 [Burkholderia cenocepacia]|uniref:hypothetical protein n=1 Tax=Burkholderia cenocepacia TaxID=95486 RepID=UPI001CF20214|nr:hypothetical protein [Burkholderia cenocepacia]MCA7965750.1 hypothetical protein [Burkholderia cenocepacia]
MNTTDKSPADRLTEIAQFLTDAVTAAGLLSHGRTDKKLAARITEQADKLRKHIHLLAASPVEQPDSNVTGEDEALRSAALFLTDDHKRDSLRSMLVDGQPMTRADLAQRLLDMIEFARRAPELQSASAQINGASVAAIQYALDAEEGFEWLSLWNEGEFDRCRHGWPDAPEDCYIGADPMHPETQRLLAATADAQLHAPRSTSARVYPDDLTDTLRHVLGFPNFRCAPYAHLMRDSGTNIGTRAEDEQAHVLHWLVKLVLDHGDRWADAAEEDLNTMRAKARATHDGEVTQ